MYPRGSLGMTMYDLNEPDELRDRVLHFIPDLTNPISLDTRMGLPVQRYVSQSHTPYVQHLYWPFISICTVVHTFIRTAVYLPLTFPIHTVWTTCRGKYDNSSV